MMEITSSEFEDYILYSVLSGELTLKVTDSQGAIPVIACLESEPLEKLFTCLENCGWNATVYTLSNSGKIRVTGVINADSALTINATNLINEPFSRYSSIGMFIDYVSTQKDGVLTSNTLTNTQVKSYGTTATLIPA